jgi:hypothetical protein
MFNENTGKWHATGYQRSLPREDFNPELLPPTVQSLLTDGFPESWAINAIWAQDIPITADSPDDLFSWLNEHSEQLGWSEEDERPLPGSETTH